MKSAAETFYLSVTFSNVIFYLHTTHDSSWCNIYKVKSKCNCNAGCKKCDRLFQEHMHIPAYACVHYIVQIRSRNQREYRCCQEDRWRCLIHSGHDKCVKCNEYCCDHRCQEIAWLQCKYHNIDCPGKECSDTIIPYLLSSDLKPESKSRTCNRTGDQLDRYTVIQDKMIGLVKEQLLSTDKTTSQIAYEIGFQYPQHLSRMFKRVVGMTPNKFRLQSWNAILVRWMR